MTFDPKDVDQDGKLRISNGGTKDDDTQYYVPNNKTDQYEVRCITVNYMVKVLHTALTAPNSDMSLSIGERRLIVLTDPDVPPASRKVGTSYSLLLK